MQAEKQHNFAIFKRISSAILLISVAILAVNLWLMHSANAQQWYQIESEQLGRSLTKQAAKMLSVALENQQQDMLEYYIDVINQGNFVEGAVIFNANGERLHQIENNISVIEIIKQRNISPLVFVEDVKGLDGEILAYVKIVLNKDEVTQHHRSFNEGQLSQTTIIIGLTVIITMLITRIFYKFRYRHVDGEENKLL